MNGAQVVTVTVLAVGYPVWAYFHEYRDCPRCKGSGRNRGSTNRRRGKCGRCKGTREVKTCGAQLLHRAVRSMAGYRNDRKEK